MSEPELVERGAGEDWLGRTTYAVVGLESIPGRVTLLRRHGRWSVYWNDPTPPTRLHALEADGRWLCLRDIRDQGGYNTPFRSSEHALTVLLNNPNPAPWQEQP